jgi:glycine oxidase
MPAGTAFDVAIAGAGLIGSSIAFELACAGLRVAVFDRQQPGHESSWAGAGILSPAPENPGMVASVPLGKASMAAYPAYIAAIEEISGQFCGYRPKGTIEPLFSRQVPEDVRAELSTIIAVHHGVGLRAEPLRAEDARELEPALSDDLEAAILRPDEASVDNRALTAAVVEAARRSGAQFFPGRSATAIRREANRCSGFVVSKENGGEEKIGAGATVIAAGCYSAKIAGVAPYAPVQPAKGQMLALRAAEVKIERVLWSDKAYLVPRNDGRILAGASVEYVGFDKTTTAGAVEKILAGAIELAPGLARAAVEEIWAGLRPDSPDHLPILGPTDVDNLFVATGHFRSGILLAPITAHLMRQWLTGGKSPLTAGSLNAAQLDLDRFSPLRFLSAQAAKPTM